MITFKQYLQEEGKDKIHTTLKQAATAFIKHCKTWVDIEKPLWRLSGVPIGTLGHEMRSRVPRTRLSASYGDSSEMQLYLESLPAYADYPKRRQSTFCSTTQRFEVGTVNKSKNNLLVIFPYDGVSIAALTEDPDFNFVNVLKATKYDDGICTPVIFQIMIKQACLAAFRRHDGTLAGNISYFKETFLKDGKFDPNANGDKKVAAALEKHDHYVSDFIKVVCEDVPECFAPDKIGIELVNSSSINLDGSQHEVWFSGKYLSIPANHYEAFKNKVLELKEKL